MQNYQIYSCYSVYLVSIDDDLCLQQFSDIIIPTNETARQSYFLELYLTHEIPLMFVGPTGTGKSAITNSYLVKLPKDKLVRVDA